jgi:hypothetical protein
MAQGKPWQAVEKHLHAPGRYSRAGGIRYFLDVLDPRFHGDDELDFIKKSFSNIRTLRILRFFVAERLVVRWFGISTSLKMRVHSGECAYTGVHQYNLKAGYRRVPVRMLRHRDRKRVGTARPPLPEPAG